MDSLSDIFNKYKIRQEQSVIKPPRARNQLYEQAEEFANYVGLKPAFVMRLFKKFGVGRVLNLRSWIKDAPRTPGKRFEGLVYWKLKQDVSKTETTTKENTETTTPNGTQAGEVLTRSNQGSESENTQQNYIKEKSGYIIQPVYSKT